MTRPAPHHLGDFPRRARLVRAIANANPSTLCWRCGRTLPEHGPKAKWQAGHVIDGQIGGELRPEASTCNAAAGARLTNARRQLPPLSPMWK